MHDSSLSLVGQVMHNTAYIKYCRHKAGLAKWCNATVGKHGLLLSPKGLPGSDAIHTQTAPHKHSIHLRHDIAARLCWLPRTPLAPVHKSQDPLAD